jgi:MSHA pilin protein MshD
MIMPRHSRRAFTMIECCVSVGILGILLVVALQVVGASTKNQYHTAQRAIAASLAQSLLAEISELPYQEPSASSSSIGLDAGETAASKVNYDDVDDFNGWTESPPQDRAGNVMTDLSGWTRSVAVAWVNPSNIAQSSSTETGVKMITVTVTYNGTVMATRTCLRGNYP